MTLSGVTRRVIVAERRQIARAKSIPDLGANALGTNHLVLNGLVNCRQRKPRHRRDLRRRVSVILNYSLRDYYSTLTRDDFPVGSQNTVLRTDLGFTSFTSITGTLKHGP